MPKTFRCHLFWCGNLREDPAKPSCAARGSMEIGQKMKQYMRDKGLRDEVAVTKSGCIGQCAEGPSAIVYPEGVWYRIPSVEDAFEIVDEHLEKGRVVERLVIRD